MISRICSICKCNIRYRGEYIPLREASEEDDQSESTLVREDGDDLEEGIDCAFYWSLCVCVCVCVCSV